MTGLLAWFSANLALGPSIGLAIAGLIWALSCATVKSQDEYDPRGFVIAAGMFSIVGALVISITGGGWAYWLPFLAGVVTVPAYYLGKAFWQSYKVVAQQEAEEQKAKAAAYAQSPAGVVERCERIVRAYVDGLPKDLATIEETRRAETKLDALRGLFKLLEAAERFNELSSQSFEENLESADALFTDVSLQRKCKKLVKQLRERSTEDDTPTADIKVAIEGVVLSILELPRRARARIGDEVPTEYKVAFDDLSEQFGGPVLPILADEPEEVTPRPRHPRRTETA